jgi:hypothetical protein
VTLRHSSPTPADLCPHPWRRRPRRPHPLQRRHLEPYCTGALLLRQLKAGHKPQRGAVNEARIEEKKEGERRRNTDLHLWRSDWSVNADDAGISPGDGGNSGGRGANGSKTLTTHPTRFIWANPAVGLAGPLPGCCRPTGRTKPAGQTDRTALLGSRSPPDPLQLSKSPFYFPDFTNKPLCFYLFT